MQLLYSINSPYARKTRIVAIEKHVPLEFKAVVLQDPDCPVSQHNPLGKVPVLVLDDGEAIYDSSVIAEYLDLQSDALSLMPQDPLSKIRVRRWEALADGVCDAAVAVMYLAVNLTLAWFARRLEVRQARGRRHIGQVNEVGV